MEGEEKNGHTIWGDKKEGSRHMMWARFRVKVWKLEASENVRLDSTVSGRKRQTRDKGKTVSVWFQFHKEGQILPIVFLSTVLGAGILKVRCIIKWIIIPPTSNHVWRVSCLSGSGIMGRWLTCSIGRLNYPCKRYFLTLLWVTGFNFQFL